MKVSDDGAKKARENRRREDQLKNAKTIKAKESPDSVAKKLGFKKGL